MSGKLPKFWETKPIGEVGEIVNGGTPKTGVSEYWNGKHLWITPAEMGKRESPYAKNTQRKLSDEGLKNSSAKLLPPNSVILSSRAPIGHLVINETPMATNQGCKGIIPSSNLFCKFLFYFLLHNVDLLNSLGTGATFKELSGSKLKEIPMPVPPLPEQKRIVAILDKAFAEISRAKEIAEKNLANAKEVFNSFLGKTFSTSERGWELAKMADLTMEISDGDHMPPPKSRSGIPFITISNINKDSHQIDFTDTFLVPSSYYESLKQNRKPIKGDVLYTVTGSYGIPVLVDNDIKFCFQRHIGLIRPKKELHAKFLYYWIRSPEALAQANDTATGTAQKTVSLSALRNFLVPQVPYSEQLAIICQLDALSAETKRLESIYRRKLSALQELKKSILSKAFSGQLTGTAS